MKFNLKAQSKQRKETKDQVVKTMRTNYKQQKAIATRPISDFNEQMKKK